MKCKTPAGKSAKSIAIRKSDKQNQKSDPDTDYNSTLFCDLNFKVAQSFHRHFKLEATMRGMTMKELLEVCFRTYLDQNGSLIEPLKINITMK
jgi:hypothetical protein